MFKLAFLSLSLVLLLGLFNPAVSFAGEEQDFLEIEFEEIVVFHPNDWLGHGELNDVFLPVSP